MKAGVFGDHPGLTDLDDGDLKHATDFRSVYSTLLDGWLGTLSVFKGLSVAFPCALLALPMDAIASSLPALRCSFWFVTCAATAMLRASLPAADEWMDISSQLLERLAEEGAKMEWPGGCSGVVVNRTNGEVTIKVVGLGLWRSADQGKNWKEQGTAVNVWLGPFFGRDEKEMVVVGKEGIFLTKDAGGTWRRAADLKPGAKGFSYNPNWFGCYAWDPVINVLYASAMGNPVFRLKL